MAQHKALVEQAKQALQNTVSNNLDIKAAIDSGYIGSLPFNQINLIAPSALMIAKHGSEEDKQDALFKAVTAGFLNINRDLQTTSHAVTELAELCLFVGKAMGQDDNDSKRAASI